MRPVRVIQAHRCKGPFWSIEELFTTIAKALPPDFKVETTAAPASGVSLAAIRANLKWMRNIRDADIIHQTGDIHYSILAAKRPVVLTIHDVRFVEEAKGLRRLILWLGWLLLPCLRADRITVISEFTLNRLLDLCPVNPAKLRVIPNCVAPEFTPSPLHPCTDKLRLLQVGTTDNKNLSRVIQACCGLPVHLTILGELSNQQREELTKSEVEHTVVTHLSKSQVAALYAGSDVVMFVSTYEGFGMPILEAQAVGRPILTSDLSPMREVAGGGALLVNPFDVASIRSGLLQLMEDGELRQRLVEAGLQNVRAYRPEQVAARYAAVYREVMDEQSAPIS